MIYRIMNFDLKTISQSAALSHKSDLLVVLQKTADTKAPSNKSNTTSVLSQYLSKIQKEESFDAKPGKTLLLLKPEHIQAKRLMLLGTGEGKPGEVRKSVLSAFKNIKSLGYKNITLLIEEANSPEQCLKLSILAVSDAIYLYSKTKPSAKPAKLGKSQAPNSVDISVTFGVPDAKAATVQKAYLEALALGEGIELAKEWGNRPANHATPTHLGNVALNLGKHPNIKVNVLGPKEVEKLGMGSFISVAQGSSEPLRFITMEYRGARAKSTAPVVLVGKGITFDTGGISLKRPYDFMVPMKTDMTGSAVVLGAITGAAQLAPQVRITALMMLAENAVSSTSQRPSDVIVQYDGTSVEVTNTDAEGRLVLADGLGYANL